MNAARTIAGVSLAAVLLMSGGAWADEPVRLGDLASAEGRPGWSFTLYWENDGTFVKPNHATDRHDTNSNKFTLTHHPAWADALAEVMPLHEQFPRDELKTAAGYLLALEMYTPETITTSALITTDRPYAGWLYGGIYWQRASDTRFDHVEINLGMIGPSSQAEDLQRAIHAAIDDDEPRGWDNQLHDELAFSIVARRKWRIDLLAGADKADATVGFELIPHVGFAVGTVHRHIEAAATLRLGQHLPDDFGPGRLDDVVAATASSERAGELSWYVFARFGGRAVEHNVFLEGNNYKDSHGVEEEPFVGEVTVGAAVQWRRLAATYSQTYRSEEFEGQQHSNSFGTVVLSYTHPF